MMIFFSYMQETDCHIRFILCKPYVIQELFLLSQQVHHVVQGTWYTETVQSIGIVEHRKAYAVLLHIVNSVKGCRRVMNSEKRDFRVESLPVIQCVIHTADSLIPGVICSGKHNVKSGVHQRLTHNLRGSEGGVIADQGIVRDKYGLLIDHS